MRRSSAIIILMLAGAAAVAAAAAVNTQEAAVPDQAALEAMTRQFAPVEIGADVGALPANERKALARLVEAAWVMDGLFLRQAWAGNEGLLQRLLSEPGELGAARLHYFLINKGPWDRLDHNRPFIPGVPPRPEGANFYPADSTKAEVAAWLQGLSGEARKNASGFFTTIRRVPGGGFAAVPYSVEYQGELARAAGLLREAASLTEQPTLKKFLSARADAFLSNDYYASDVAWMELDASIEPTIGPYEVYEDGWFNAKAAFEAFITLRDEAESAKLARLGAELQDIENNLPIAPRFRNPRLGSLAPIRVVNVVLAAGDGNRGVQTAAFNLPNDERVVREKGAKRVMLRNVQEAKFKLVLLPISSRVLAPADRGLVTFEAFFTHILMHELMHGLGPHQISVGGEETTVRARLKETYSAVEEAKADISGLFALQYLIDKGVLDKALEANIYETFLASAFRSIRFGLNEAHGKGIALQLNSLLDAGAFTVNRDGTFAVDRSKIKDAVRGLTGELMTLEAEGDYEKAKAVLDRLAVVRPEVQAALGRLSGIPVDIEPRFESASRLLSENGV